MHNKPKVSLKCHRIWMCICNYAYPTAQVKLFWKILTNALKALINNLFKKVFIEKEKNN